MIILKLIFTFVLSYFFIKLIINNALYLGLTDIPNERSSHTKITPRGAGIGFGFSFFISILIFEFSLFLNYWLVFLSMFMVFLVGILDDHKDATPRAKFYVIFLATIFLFLDDISIYSLGVFLGLELKLWYFALPFTMFALAGFTNALNLIDGLDGLAGTISLVILSTFLYIGYINDDNLIVTLCLFSMTSVLAFLIFNWNPARIFMGDSGSLFLGFVISVIAVISLKYIHPISVFYLTALPILDTVVVMVRRIRKRISPFSPDKTHIHHILLGFFSKKVKTTVIFLILLQCLFSIAGLMMANSSNKLTLGSYSFFAFVAFIFIIALFYMVLTGMKRRQKLIEKLSNRKKRINSKQK